MVLTCELTQQTAFVSPTHPFPCILMHATPGTLLCIPLEAEGTRTVPSSLDQSPLPRSYQSSTVSPGRSANCRTGMAARPMNVFAPNVSFSPFTTLMCTSSCAARAHNRGT